MSESFVIPVHPVVLGLLGGLALVGLLAFFGFIAWAVATVREQNRHAARHNAALAASVRRALEDVADISKFRVGSDGQTVTCRGDNLSITSSEKSSR